MIPTVRSSLAESFRSEANFPAYKREEKIIPAPPTITGEPHLQKQWSFPNGQSKPLPKRDYGDFDGGKVHLDIRFLMSKLGKDVVQDS